MRKGRSRLSMQPMRPRRISESAGTGRQARLRGVCQPTWEFKSPLSHHVVADFVSFATTFFFYAENVISHSLRRSSFPNRTRFAWLRFGFLFGDLNSRAAVNDLSATCQSREAGRRARRLQVSSLAQKTVHPFGWAVFCFTLSGSVSGTARGYSPSCPGSSG